MAKVIGTTGQNQYLVEATSRCAVCGKVIDVNTPSQPVQCERKRDKHIYYKDAHPNCVPC